MSAPLYPSRRVAARQLLAGAIAALAVTGTGYALATVTTPHHPTTTTTTP